MRAGQQTRLLVDSASVQGKGRFCLRSRRWAGPALGGFQHPGQRALVFPDFVGPGSSDTRPAQRHQLQGSTLHRATMPSAHRKPWGRLSQALTRRLQLVSSF